MRRMVCSECGEDLDVAEFFAEKGAADRGRTDTAQAGAGTLPRPSARLTGEKKQHSEQEKEEMLRALKRKMEGK